MKKLAVTVVIMLFTTISFAQKMKQKNIPASVLTAFQKIYPTAKEINWDKEGDKYEASFDLNKIEHSVLMDAQGNLIESEVEIDLNQLPKGVLTYVKTNYPGRPAKEGAKIIDAKGNVTYEVEIKGMDLIFDSNGTFIKELKDN